MTSNTLLLAFCGLTLTLASKWWKQPPLLPLPPSPPGEPIIGHLRTFLKSDWEAFLYTLGQTYGPLTRLRVLGKEVIVVSETKTAKDLLEGRASNFSGRPRMPLAEVIRLDGTVAMIDYGLDWRRPQRVIQRYFSKDKIQTSTNRWMWVEEARLLVSELMAGPQDFGPTFVNFATSIVTRVGYGHKVTRADDPYVGMVDGLLKNVSPLLPLPVASLLDLFPIFKYFFYLPILGGKLKRARDSVYQFGKYMTEDTTERMAEGLASPSFIVEQREALENGSQEFSMEEIRDMTLSLYTAGIDATASVLSNFMAAMVLYPEVQTKAQAEIDGVLKGQRLPTFVDRQSFPFLECVIQETMRWRPPVPIGIPHKSGEDEIYDGMFIPAGSLILPNIRAMALDDSIYNSPHSFDPTRYLSAPDGRGEPLFTGTFGFGRRTCPGQFLVEDTVWIAIVTIIATVTVGRTRDGNGVEMVPEIDFETNTTCRVKSFPCKVQPRHLISHRLLAQGPD